MAQPKDLQKRIDQMLESAHPESCNYLGVIAELAKNKSFPDRKQTIDRLYEKVYQEIVTKNGKPESPVSFGTSGWRGLLGKDLFCKSVAQVVLAILEMYKELEHNSPLAHALGVEDIDEVRQKGCVIGYDNRFGNEILAKIAVSLIADEGIKVYFAGESTTGVLSASVLQLKAAFSINFTPSHNPLEYGGLKFNAADGGPAASEITNFISQRAVQVIEENRLPLSFSIEKALSCPLEESVVFIDSLSLWQDHVRQNRAVHGLDYDKIIQSIKDNSDILVVIDSVHGAARLHIDRFFKGLPSVRLLHLRGEKDVTFGGIAPEPSSENMANVMAVLQSRKEKFKLGAIIDPDGDRIRFTDGIHEISMNQFGAMAYHFLHETKRKKGMVAKTVATSNFANSVAEGLGEEVFEPRVGFKEFKPVIDRALVCFEESDGITVIGHTPEKDAYIGLLIALDILVSTGNGLVEYLQEMERRYGSFYPDRDGVVVTMQGKQLQDALALLQKYKEGVSVEVDGENKIIAKVIDIDGRKILFQDGSWLMVRPSGTEPKVRFYVESRSADGTKGLVAAAQEMLGEIHLL
ncbi:MAG: phosphoglucomutase [Desulfopila sp.]|jgi:phosphomannomutase|nr:phosphoglucomutase [Desulfopila sp.]